jgi:D-mannose binding lectin.
MLHGRVEGAQVLAHETVQGLLFRPARSVGIAGGGCYSNFPAALWNGSSLQPNTNFVAPSRWAKITMQNDGNLVVYANYGTPASPNWRETWSSFYESGTMSAGDFATLTANGALQVGTSPTSVRYDSQTSGFRNTYLSIDDEGYIYIYRIVTAGSGDSRGFTY